MMIRNFVATCVALSAVTASAGIVSLTGEVQQIPAPFSVQENAVESNTSAGLFTERQGLTLTAPVALNISTSGVFNETIDLTPTTIPAGAKVNSYFFHADSNNKRSFSGEFTFDEPILGIILAQTELQASHLALGNPAVTYPSTGSSDALRAALELGSSVVDELQLNKTTRVVKFLVQDEVLGGRIYDHFRVITAATVVPEPASVLMLLGGLAAVVIRRQR